MICERSDRLLMVRNMKLITPIESLIPHIAKINEPGSGCLN